MLKLLKKYSYKILWLAIIIYSIFFSYLSLKKYHNFIYNAYDLTIFNQVFYNTVSGHLFAMTFNLHNYLADHFTPIIILILPFYYFWQNPESLLILQSIVLALCAWPLYLISQKVIKHKLVSLFIVALWFSNFLVHNANLFEFHLLPFAIFFILWAFYFYYNSNFKAWLLFFILALLVREDVGFLLLGFSFLSLLDKRDKKWLITPLLSILYFLVTMQIISFFNFGENNKFLLYYAWLGGDSFISILWAWTNHFWQFLGHLLQANNFLSFFIILLPLGFLPLLGLRYLFLLLFPTLQFMLTAQGINSAVYSMHYGLIFLPGLFIASIFGFKKIINKEKFVFSNIIFKNKNLFIILFIFTISYFSLFFSPVKNILFNDYNIKLRDNRQYFINKIPDEASIVVSASLAPALSSRSNIYPLQHSYLGSGQFYLDSFVFPQVDYILIDMKDMFDVLSYAKSNKDKQNIKSPEYFRNRLNDYVLIKAKANLLLWQHKSSAKGQDSLLIYNFNKKPLNFENDNFVVSFDYLREEKNNLIINYQKTQSEYDNYLLRLYSDDTYIDLPLDYGLLAYSDWPDDMIISFYYYLDKDIDSYQIFTWQGEVKLGYLREVIVDFDLKAFGERKYINL